MTTSTLIKTLSIAGTGATAITVGIPNLAQAITIIPASEPVLPEENQPTLEHFTLAESGTTITPDDPWYQFSFTTVGKPANGCFSDSGCVPSSGDNSLEAGAAPWEFFVPASGATLKVTDAFSRGDVFKIFNFDTFVGSTSLVEVDNSLVQTNDPEIAFADSSYSSGIFELSPGKHSIKIIPSVSPFQIGAAYFRVETIEHQDEPTSVPEPSSVLALLALGSLTRLRKGDQSS